WFLRSPELPYCVSAGVALQRFVILLSSRLQPLLGDCVPGEAQQINQGLRRLNAATGDFVYEAGNATPLAAPF
ncbi:hypothetical protein ABVT39_020531, partial [Epinephelus coioides]